MQGLCFRSCRVRCRCSEVQAWASGRELGRSCPTLSLPLPSKPQHSSPGRRSLMESRLGGSFLLSGEEKRHCIAWPRAKGTPQPSKQTSGKRVLTHLVQQEVLLHTDGHRLPDGYSLCGAKEKQVTASATSRHSYCLRAGVRWQMKRVTAVPGPKQRQPRGSPSAGSGPLTARTRSHQRPVVAVDPCTFGGDIWTSGGTLHCGAILPEVYLGPHHTCRSLLVGTSHVGANPFQMLPVVCQKLLQDAAPTTVQPL